jgi:hypothetical protein
MSAEALHFENKNSNLDQLRSSLQALKEKASLTMMEIIKDPADERLYRLLEKYPKSLYEWFFVRCGEGEKLRERYLSEVTEVLKIQF